MRENKLRKRGERLMNNLIWPAIILPMIAVIVPFYALFWVLRPVGWVVLYFRKPLASALAGVFCVAGLYWGEFMQGIELINRIDHTAYVVIKYGMPWLLFSIGFRLTSDLYSDENLDRPFSRF